MNVVRFDRSGRAAARLAMLLGTAALLCAAGAAAASTPVLGAADSFAVLGASAVTNTNATRITGDLGVYPGSAITGLGTITLDGALHQDDVIAHQAHNDAANAFSTLAGLSPTANLTGSDLGTLVGSLTPGVYRFDSSAQLTGNLTLDFSSDPNGTFVFQIGSTLTTASGSNVLVLNGVAGSAVYWDVGSSATFGTTTTFAGNVIADQSITLDTGARILCGRAIALSGAVTMDNNTLSNDCGAGSYASGRGDFGSHGFDGASGGSGGGPAVPEPTTWSLMLFGFGGLGIVLRARRQRPALAAG